jgi:hypothetical protein
MPTITAIASLPLARLLMMSAAMHRAIDLSR